MVLAFKDAGHLASILPARSALVRTACPPRAFSPDGLPLALFPPVSRFVVGGARLDPRRAACSMLFLPEGGPRLKVIHDELAGGESVTAMRARHRDQHDLVIRLQVPVAMNHRAIHHLPARRRFVDDLADLALGHAGIVLERHAHVAYQADETRHGADTRALGNRAHLGAE